MKYLLRSQLRDLITRPIASCAMVLNLILAVFAIVVVHVASYTLVYQLSKVQPDAEYDYIVPFVDKEEGSYFKLRERWRAGELSDIAAMVPVIEGNLAIEGRAIPVVGIDLVSDLHVASTFGVQHDQLAFLTQDSVIAFGDDLGNTSIPSHIKVLDHRSGSQSFLLADVATAQNLLQRSGEIDAAWLRYKQTPVWDWLEHLFPGLTTGIGIQRPEISLPILDIQSMANWNPTRAFAGSIAFNMGLLGMLAVLVSCFITYEATASNVRRRAREFDRLQTIGVTKAQIRLVLTLPTLTLLVLSACIAAILAFVFLELNALVDTVPLSVFVFATVKGLILGLLTVVVGVSLAFSRETDNLSPLFVTLATVLALATLYYGIWMNSTLVGAYAAILALCVLHIVVLTPGLVQFTSSIVPRLALKNLISRMNLRSLAQQLRKANVAVIAFSLAIAAVIGITLMISSLRTDFFSLLESRLPPGLQIREAGELDPKHIKSWAGVVDVREYYRGDGELPIGKTSLVATTLDEFEARRYGFTYDPKINGIFVNEKVATQAQVQIGDELALFLPGADPINLPVVHIFKSYGDPSRLVILPVDQVSIALLVRDRLLVVVRPDSFASVEQLLRESYPATTVLNHQEIRQRAREIFEKTFALTNLIALIAVLVAVIGLFNASLAMHSTRQVEFRLLETIGFTKLALLRQSVSQATMLGCICCLLSLPLGFAIAWILCELVNPRAFQWTIDLHVAPTAITLPLLLGLSAAVLTSVIPWFIAHRSSR